jgi:hypothetical protein
MDLGIILIAVIVALVILGIFCIIAAMVQKRRS